MPTVLLTTTGHLPSTARLAVALAQVGCAVNVACPPNHPVEHIRSAPRRLVYSPLRPLHSLEAAIARILPDLVIPCDERTVRHLHRLHATTASEQVREILARSLGPDTAFAAGESRYDLLASARQAGVLVPDVRAIAGEADLRAWHATQPLPWVLKSDGSWAGLGVRIVSTFEQAVAALHDLDRPVSGLHAIRQTVVESDGFLLAPWLNRDRHAVSVQQYIRGRPANCGLACWNGEILAGVFVEVLETESATGAATVVRVVEGEAMREGAARVVKALGLSGLIGFDFMIEQATGDAYMIEMNPRVTPVCVLPLGPGRDPVEALVAKVSGRPVRHRHPLTQQDLIALFPQPLQESPTEALLTAHHDIPWDEPALMRELLKPRLPESHWLLRRLRPLWRSLRASQEPPPPPARPAAVR